MSATVSPSELLEPPKSFAAARFGGVFFSPGATLPTSRASRILFHLLWQAYSPVWW